MTKSGFYFHSFLRRHFISHGHLSALTLLLSIQRLAYSFNLLHEYDGINILNINKGFFKAFYFMSIDVLLKCMCIICVSGACGVLKRVSDPLEV